MSVLFFTYLCHFLYLFYLFLFYRYLFTSTLLTGTLLTGTFLTASRKNQLMRDRRSAIGRMGNKIPICFKDRNQRH
jgi:hypothetical protein